MIYDLGFGIWDLGYLLTDIRVQVSLVLKLLLEHRVEDRKKGFWIWLRQICFIKDDLENRYLYLFRAVEISEHMVYYPSLFFGRSAGPPLPVTKWCLLPG